MMASDWVNRWPSCTSVGTRLCGFTSRYAALTIARRRRLHEVDAVVGRTAAIRD